MTQPRKHRHAELIKRWLDDDSLIVETMLNSGNWRALLNPCWAEGNEYRFKSKMITVGDHSFPEPMRVAPVSNVTLWLCDFPYLAAPFNWCGHESDFKWLKLGLLHTTQAAAEAHARALIALTESKS